ncbi:tetratricopeptide (TPR) repeat protein [Streptomyces sp. SAI-170]|uniref:CHAT domain-containing protein n=1 Tax=Streptomyces sp. SAI-170 TaxID=3377729 RepID=UPI003C7EA7FC
MSDRDELLSDLAGRADGDGAPSDSRGEVDRDELLSDLAGRDDRHEPPSDSTGEVDRHGLLSDLRGRIDRAVERQEPAGLFAPEAERVAAALTAVTDPVADPEAGHVLGWYRWLRYETSADGGQDEAVEAVRLLAPVHAAAPDAVPELVGLMLAGGPEDGVVGDVALELGLAVTLAYERGRQLSLLHRALMLFRMAVAGPFEEPLDRAMSLSNLGHVLRMLHEQGARDGELDEAVAVTREAVRFTAHPELAMFRSNLGLALLHVYWRDHQVPVLEESVALTRAAVDATPPGHPNVATYRNNLALGLHALAERREDAASAEEAIALTRTVLAAVPEGPARAAQLHILSFALRAQYERLREPGLLDEAVAVGRQAVAATPEGDPARAERQDKLAICLYLLFRRSGGPAALEEAIDRARAATNAPVAPDRGRRQSNLAELLRTLAEHSHRPEAAWEAVALARAAVEAVGARGAEAGRDAVRVGSDGAGATSEGVGDVSGADAVDSAAAGADAAGADAAGTDAAGADAAGADAADSIAAGSTTAGSAAGDTDVRAARLSGLSAALHTLYLYTSDLDHLTEAVQRGREAVEGTPAGRPDRARALNNLGFGLRVLHEAVGDDELLDEAIEVSRRALAPLSEDDPYRPTVLTNLASALIRKYERSDRVEHADEAVAHARAAVDLTPAGHPDRPGWLNNLALALYGVGNRLGRPEPLREAIAVCREALAALPDGHLRRATVLNNLGNCQAVLFEHLGDIALLRTSAETARAAVEATPPGHPHRAMNLNGLGRILQHITWYTGDSAPLSEAVAACRAAVGAAPRGTLRQMFLGNLGSALDLSFRRTGRREDIAEAITSCRDAVSGFAPDHPLRVQQLHGLTTALLVHALLGDGGPEVVDEAIDTARAGLAATPLDHPNRVRMLADLAYALRARTLLRRDPAPLTEATAVTREALALAPPGLPLRSGLLNDHAVTLHLLHEHTHDPALVPEILAVSREAASDASASIAVRVASYRRIAVLATGADPQGRAPSEALAAAEAAVALLPRIGIDGLDLGDRGHQIGEAGSPATAAAAAALDAGLPGRAVELLEQSRGVLTAESVAAGGADLQRLRTAVPEVAELFEEVRSRRETLNRPAPEASADPPAPHDVRAAARRDAQAEWDAVLARIRTLDGFADFLAPPGADRLTAEAREGPVVYVSAAPTRGDALVLDGDPAHPVRVVPLRLTEPDLLPRIRTLGTALDRATDPTVGPDGRQAAQRDILGVLAWLWDTVTEPVLTALGHTRPPAPGAPWPRLWWCPVGLMAYLPLHAAGHHEDVTTSGDAPRTALDRVVSSYTATVRGLSRARAHRDEAAAADPGKARTTGGAVVVAVGDAAGVAGLPGAVTEAELLTGLIPGATVPQRPTRASVLAALPGHPVAHFACHSEPHRMDPWRGRLVLHDHETDPLTVADIGALRLGGGLAFLSACNTTLTTPRLADEALHITGAFQLAGYPYVVGTLWPVSDRAAHQLAADFYTRLTAGGTTAPDPTRSAESLHHATRRLRARYPLTPTLWAAHTHTGA